MKKMLTIFTVLAAVIISSTPVLAEFSDVPASHQNYQAINWLQDKGIINGYPDGTFKPYQNVNRVEALKMILLGSSVSGETASNDPSTDVPKGEWFAEYVQKAKSLGIVNGYPDGSFGPTRTINLAEALKMILKTGNINTDAISVSEDPYKDVPKNEWFAVYFQYANNKKLLDANASDNVNPATDMTRGALAEIMYRLAYIQENNLDQFSESDSDADDFVTEEDDSTDDFTLEESDSADDEMMDTMFEDMDLMGEFDFDL